MNGNYYESKKKINDIYEKVYCIGKLSSFEIIYKDQNSIVQKQNQLRGCKKLSTDSLLVCCLSSILLIVKYCNCIERTQASKFYEFSGYRYIRHVKNSIAKVLSLSLNVSG